MAIADGDLLVDERLNLNQLAVDALGFSVSVGQRTGHLIDFMARELGIDADTGPLHQRVTEARLSTQRLRPDEPGRSHVDDRWRIDVNTDIEHDL
ncbi:MAG: hypothetical protein ABIP17_11485 [Ilumatobacteraceae bacterium]